MSNPKEKTVKKSTKKASKTVHRAKKALVAAAVVATILSGKKLYKVLSPEGESQNGGTFKWSLPEGAKPGDWHEEQSAVMCSKGFHLTAEPVKWWKPKCRVFEVEAKGILELGGEPQWSEDKVVATKTRLVRELTERELVDVGIIRSGVHELKGDGTFIVEGSAKVTAYDSAKVTAYDSASVTAYDSAKVTAYDSASVTAWGSASVTAYDSASVTAYDSAKVTAWGSAKVTAWGSASVTAWGSALICIPKNYSSGVIVILEGTDAVLVDRRPSGKPTITIAGGP